jgi:hypothetical protein
MHNLAERQWQRKQGPGAGKTKEHQEMHVSVAGANLQGESQDIGVGKVGWGQTMGAFKDRVSCLDCV